MAASAALKSRLQVSVAGSSFTTVGGLDSIDVDMGPENADISEFGDVAKRQLPTQKVAGGSVSGKLNAADGGQAIVLPLVVTPALLYVKYIPNNDSAGTFYKCQCAIKDIKIGAKQGPDAVSFSFSFECADGAGWVTS
jgi:hypothetical protein